MAAVSDALAVLLFPRFAVATCTPLLKVPDVVGVTFTTIAQLSDAAKLPPLSWMLPLPGAAVTLPPQEFVRALGVATTNPTGKLLVKSIPLAAVPALGLLIA